MHTGAGQRYSREFTRDGALLLLPSIDLIAPKVLVSLGERAYVALAAARGVARKAVREAVDALEASGW